MRLARAFAVLICAAALAACGLMEVRVSSDGPNPGRGSSIPEKERN